MAEKFVAPHPGSQQMPQWDTGELIDAPKFTLRNWTSMLGPGLVMGGAAIGGGEWLVGPLVTAKYGGALLWLAGLSILGQVLYNIEISRYTLYSGEPIFNGKFRILPSPVFWLVIYLLLDFGMVFPYLAANAATPVATLIKGGVVPRPEDVTSYWWLISDWWLMKILAYMIFLGAMVPLLFGGKVYNSLRRIMTFKIVVVLGFLLILAVGWSTADTWKEITTGFFKIGTVPIERGEDLNDNGVLDEGEDWDSDGRLDVLEPKLRPIEEHIASGDPWPDFNHDGKPDPLIDSDGDGKYDTWGDLNGDGEPEKLKTDDDGQPIMAWPDLVTDENGNTDGRPDTFIDTNGDGFRDGENVDNVFVALYEGRPMPTIDWTMIAFIAALAAIAGSGGLSNTPVSNYTRDQGWGMGHHVGAIPSVVGGQNIQLSHVGCVFEPNEESLPRWRRWYRHVVRDQLVVWMPACFIGLALPCMLSVQFLRRGYEADNWTAAAMTAEGVGEAVGLTNPLLGSIFWFMTLCCGFLVLAPSVSSSADGLVRRWVDVFWTGSSHLRKLDPKRIKIVYFLVLAGFVCIGLVTLAIPPGDLVKWATMFFNIALGFSCWHTLVVNMVLLPRPLRPGWPVRIGLALAGVFFFTLGVITVMDKTGILAKLTS